MSVQDVLDDENKALAMNQFIDDVRHVTDDEKAVLLQRPVNYVPKSYDACAVAAAAEYLADEANLHLDWVDNDDFRLDEETYPAWLTMPAYREWVKAHVDPIFHKHNLMCDKSAMSRA